jgi:tetratricopeptide (TPR) repeat protein
MKRFLTAIMVIILISSIMGISGCGNNAGSDAAETAQEPSARQYGLAVRLYEEGKLEQALEAFKQVDADDETHYSLSRNKIDQLTQTLFEKNVNQARDYYTAEEYDRAVSSLETALGYRNSRPVRDLLEHYKSTAARKQDNLNSPEDIQQAKKQMLTYEGGTGVLEIALDNIYTKEFAIGNVPIETSGNIVFLKLWVNIINGGEKDVLVKPEYVKLITSDNTAYYYHSEYTMHLDNPFVETLLPPKGKASGRVMVLIPLESFYSFEYDDNTNRVEKTVIPY